MKFKTTAIAMAVAGTVAAPVAVQAGADEIYASARIGVQYQDSGDTSDTDIKSFSSRFGARGETDLGNGLTGFGRYEWDVDESDFSIRHRYVGLKGDWGSVLLGKTYDTWYTFAVGPVDRPWWHAGYAMIDYGSRQDNQITYSGSADAFAFGVTGVFISDSEEDSPDVYEVGASYTFGNDMVLSAAYKGTQADEDDGTGTLIGNSMDEDIFAATFSGVQLGDVNMAFNAQVQDDDTSQTIDIAFMGFYAHFELEQIDADSPANFNEDGDDQDRVSSTLGYFQSIGRKTSAYYEFNYIDQDSGDSDDDRTAVMAVLKYDII
jgi:predicted porin